MKNYLLLIPLTFIFFSCNEGLNNPLKINEELSHPLIVKGMRLGLDYEEQISIAEKNNVCENNASKENQKCCYMLNEYITVTPTKFLYSLYEDKKVLGQVILSLNSPGNFPKLYENGKLVEECDYQCLKMHEVEDVISMYNKKYGKGSKYKFEGVGGSVTWQKDDLFIKLEFYDANYSYGTIHPQLSRFYEENAYHTTILYRYNDEKIKLLKNDITHNGEVIGNKI